MHRHICIHIHFVTHTEPSIRSQRKLAGSKAHLRQSPPECIPHCSSSRHTRIHLLFHKLCEHLKEDLCNREALPLETGYLFLVILGTLPETILGIPSPIPMNIAQGASAPSPSPHPHVI